MLLIKLEMFILCSKFASPSGDSKNLKLTYVEPKAKKNKKKKFDRHRSIECRLELPYAFFC